MRTEPEATRIVRSWLEEGRTALPDHILDAVLAELPATHQRRPLWPARRIDNMNAFAKLAMAAAAVVVVAIIGINVLPRSDGVTVGGPPVSPSSPESAPPSPSAVPSLRPEPTIIAGAFPDEGELSTGRHTLRQNGINFSIEVTTEGWESSGVAVAPDGGSMLKDIRGSDAGIWMLFWSIDGVYSDPCGSVPGPRLSPSAADLADAVASLPGTELVAGPSDVIVGGRPAKHVVIAIPEDIPCGPSQFLLWYDDVRCADANLCSRWASTINEVLRVWIIELDGTHIWIEAETYRGAGPEIEQEIQQIIDSIQFE